MPVTLADLKISTKQGSLIPFVPNEVQASYLDVLCPDWRLGDTSLRGRRERILKARQEGMSTLILALIFLDTINHPRRRSLIVAHDLESTEILFEMIHRYQAELPDEKRIPTQRSNRRELYWPSIDSRIFVATAGRDSVGRGATLHNLHKSERALWKVADLEMLDAGLNEAVPTHGNIFEETTANGMGHFYSDWQASKEGQDGYAARFFPWFIHSEYRAIAPEDFAATEEEDKLVAAYGLDTEQLEWRRQKVRDLKDLFPQEYPCNDIEAFRRSADNAYYATAYLQDLLLWLQRPENAPLERLSMEEEYVGGTGTLEIYEWPEKNIPYVIGADVAEGIHDDKDHDYSTADIFRGDTWEQVASYHGRPDPVAFAELLAFLGGNEWYKDAFLIVERNNDGKTTLAELARLGYSNLYHHKIVRMVEGQREEQTKAGYETTEGSKRIRDNRLARAILEASWGVETFLIRSQRAINELIHYVKLPNGGARGEGKCHDDHNTSVGQALYALQERGHLLPRAHDERPDERTFTGYGSRRKAVVRGY